MFFYSVGCVVDFAMEVLGCSVGFCAGLLGVLSQVQCDIQEVDILFVGVDGNALTLSLNMRHISFLMFSVALGKASVIAGPSSL